MVTGIRSLCPVRSVPFCTLPVTTLAVACFAAFAITTSATSAATAPAPPPPALVSVFVNVAAVISRSFRVVAVTSLSANFDNLGFVAAFVILCGLKGCARRLEIWTARFYSALTATCAAALVALTITCSATATPPTSASTALIAVVFAARDVATVFAAGFAAGFTRVFT